MTTTNDPARAARGVTADCPAWCDGHADGDSPDGPDGNEWHEARGQRQHLHLRGYTEGTEKVDPDYQGVGVHLTQHVAPDGAPIITLMARNDDGGSRPEEMAFVELTPAQAVRLALMLVIAKATATCPERRRRHLTLVEP